MIEQILALAPRSIHVADVGAAFICENPSYQVLIDRQLCRLTAFEPDPREFDNLRQHLGDAIDILPYALGDGQEHTVYICPQGFGMNSLLAPDPINLNFFNCFPEWGSVIGTERVLTRRLDDLAELAPIDFLKMDVQGSELPILNHGHQKLSQCVAVQTEISFITLYKGQATFGDIDREMRQMGFIPHRFVSIKNWSIAPTLRAGEPRFPYNQLLEADIVYIRDIIHPESMENEQIAKLAMLAHFVFESPDLAARCLIELQNRGAIDPNATDSYYASLS